MDSLQVVVERATDSRRQNEVVNALRQHGPAPSLRADFARCAIDLACEHHSAIIRLVCAGEYGSAAAMLRPLLEASSTASWLLYVPNCDRVRELATSIEAAEGRCRDLPLLDEMARDLQPTFPLIKPLVDGLKNRGPATWLHKYTHGGAAQLVRRAPGWTEGEVMLILLRADLFAILAACHETVVTPNPQLSAYAFGRRDQLGSEGFERFGFGPVAEQPHELPPALADGCGVPFSI
ncbi:MAG TPA: hypothetical protein VIT90_17075 [Lysobacter sp.]